MRLLIAGAIVTIAAASFAARGSHHGAIGTAAVSTPDPFSQANFPCQEDEALMYSPTFGTEKVGCVPIDEIEAYLP